MANEVVLADRRVIVELGSGISTIVLARLAAQRGVELTALEHDPHWAAYVRAQLERERLEGVARVVEAPLAECATGLDGAPWYEQDALAELPAAGIDLLLVDGPPGYGQGMARSRYPALPLLAGRLAAGALVVLDDAVREGERQILARWEREHDWRFAVDPTAGIAVGARP